MSYPEHPSGPVSAPPKSSKKKWIIALASGAAVLLIAGGATTAVLFAQNKSATSSRPTTTSPQEALKNWWTGTSADFNDLQNAIDDAKRAVDRAQGAGGGNPEDACLRMHDLAENKLQSHLPSPDPLLTADIAGAITDVHVAAHGCLAAQQTPPDYEQAGEFYDRINMAQRQLKAAQDIVNREPDRGLGARAAARGGPVLR
jgi:hypothetical protein